MRKNKVLIVDDDKEFLEELLETLRLHGYDAMKDATKI
jgi:DNA-binding NtrC family response regulator